MLRTLEKMAMLLALTTLFFGCEKIDLDELGGSGSGEGADGDSTPAYTVADILAGVETEQSVLVTGYIVGYIKGTSLSGAQFGLPADGPNANMLLADDPAETDPSRTMPVKLSTSGDNWRELLNLYDNPDYLHARICIFGYLNSYFRVAGITDIFDYEFLEDGGSGSGGGGNGGGGHNDTGTPGADDDPGVVDGR